jgi:hypothetical protein
LQIFPRQDSGGRFFYLYFLFILQNYTMKFIRSDHRLLWAVAHDREPNGREGQSSWATAVEVYSLCATAAGSTAVGPQQQGSANAMHHGGRSENCVKNDQNKLEKNIFSGGPTN